MPEKGSRHRPWFPFFASDFASTVRRWNAEQIGCYILLLIEQWINEDVPLDIDELARIHPDIAKHWETKLKSKFPGGRNERLEEIRADMMERSAKNRDAALRRWGRDPESEHRHADDANGDALAHANAHASGDANADAKRDAKTMRKPMLSTPTSTSTNKPRSKSKNIRSPVTDSMWQTFCQTYPARDGPDNQKSARAKANTIIKSGADWADIMTGTRRYRKHCDDKKVTGSQFVKRKDAFLSKGSWADEYPADEQGVGVDRVNELLAMSDLLGVMRRPGETETRFLERIATANDERITKLG